MAIDATHWTIDRATGDIRYTGPDHTVTGATYATVIQFHRWLQELADDDEWAAGTGDELDIVDKNPSDRSTDNIITLRNGFNVDATAIEHLYDGTVIQGTNLTEERWDGIVNFGGAIRLKNQTTDDLVTLGLNVNDASTATQVWDKQIEGSFTAEEVMRIISSALAGKASGMDTNTPIFRDINDTKNRIQAVTDANGNRTVVTLDEA